MHITYIYSVIIKNKGYAPELALGRRCQLSQLVVAPGPPPTRESPPRTP